MAGRPFLRLQLWLETFAGRFVLRLRTAKGCLPGLQEEGRAELLNRKPYKSLKKIIWIDSSRHEGQSRIRIRRRLGPQESAILSVHGGPEA